MTGKWRHGKFDHRLPKELADLLDDVSKMLRTHGSEAINQANLNSPRSIPQATDKHSKDLEWLVHYMNGTYRHGLSLYRALQNLTAKVEDVPDYEDNGCASCRRDAGHWQPVDEAGRTYCQFCRKFRGNYGVLPPLPILVARHQGKRITVQMVEDHLPKDMPRG